jgi:nucleoside-diphosphate-sugar epimerase
VERLINRGYRVRALDNLLYGDHSLRFLRDNENLELMVGDCRNIQDVVKAVRGVQVIVHLAAIVGDPACELDRATAIDTNYAATRMLIEIAKGNGVRRFVFASSCSVYGATEDESDESAPVRPISLYAQTKVDSERVLLNASGADFEPVILRFATVFGLSHRPRFDLVVNLLSAKASQDGVITIYNGHQWRPFIHVKDVAESIVKTIEAPAAAVAGQIFNVGDSRLNHTLQDVGAMIGEVFPGTRVEYVDNADRRDYKVSCEKFASRVGFRARYTVREGVEEIKQAFRAGFIVDYQDLRYHNQRYLEASGAPVNKNEVDAMVMAAFAKSPG